MNLRGTGWAKLSLAGEPGHVYVNITHGTFGMMELPGGGTRIWSGDTAAAAQPRVKSADPGHVMLPFFANVRETPEEILEAALFAPSEVN